MQNQKQVIIGSIVMIVFVTLLIVLYKKPKGNQEESTKQNIENIESEQKKLSLDSDNKIEKEQNIKNKFHTIEDGNINISGIVVEEINDKGEIIINLTPDYTEKTIKTLQVNENTKFYRMKLAEENYQYVSKEEIIDLPDIKAGDNIDVLVEAEDSLETKDVFNVLTVWITETKTFGIK